MQRILSAAVISLFVVACGPDGAGGTETKPTGLTGPELPLPSGIPGTVVRVDHAPQSLVADATTAFWFNPSTGELLSVPRAGAGAPTVVAQTDGINTDLRLDEGHLYWGGTDGIYRVAKGGGTPELIAPVGFAEDEVAFGAVLQLEVFEGYVYWTALAPLDDLGHLARAPVGGGTPEHLFTTSEPGAFTVGSGRIFVVDGDTDVLHQLPLAGGEPTVVQTNFDAYFGLWVEVERLFMVRPSPRSASQSVVNSLPVAGGTLRFEATLERSDAVFSDTTFFIWSDRFTGDLKAQRRDQTSSRTIVEVDETLHGAFVDVSGLLYFEGNTLKRLGRQ